MKFSDAIDAYIRDMRREGRMNSAVSERAYRGTLEKHCDDVHNRDPRYVGRADVKRTLERWAHPNTLRKNRSILISFYAWLVREGERPHNPAEQTPRPKKRPVETYGLSRQEILLLLGAARGPRETRAMYLLLCAGLRRGELIGLQGRHFQRDGLIWVSSDIAKGGRERVVPVVAELRPVVADIRRELEADDYVLPAQRWRDPGINREKADKRKHPSSPKALWELVREVGRRAGIAHPMRPHLLRHACATHMAKQTDVHTAQHLLGHANLATTQAYLRTPSPDELQSAVTGFAFGVVIERAFYPSQNDPANPVEARTGIEPVYTALQAAA